MTRASNIFSFKSFQLPTKGSKTLRLRHQFKEGEVTKESNLNGGNGANDEINAIDSPNAINKTEHAVSAYIEHSLQKLSGQKIVINRSDWNIQNLQQTDNNKDVTITSKCGKYTLTISNNPNDQSNISLTIKQEGSGQTQTYSGKEAINMIDDEKFISLMRVLFKKTKENKDPQFYHLFNKLIKNKELCSPLKDFCEQCRERLNILEVTNYSNDADYIQKIVSPLNSTIKGLEIIGNVANKITSCNSSPNKEQEMLKIKYDLMLKIKYDLMQKIHKFNRILEKELTDLGAELNVGKTVASNYACDAGGYTGARATDSSVPHTGLGATTESLGGLSLCEIGAGVFGARTLGQKGWSSETKLEFKALKTAVLCFYDELADNSNSEIKPQNILTDNELKAMVRFLDKSRMNKISQWVARVFSLGKYSTTSRKEFEKLNAGRDIELKDFNSKSKVTSFSIIEVEAKLLELFNNVYKNPNDVNSQYQLMKYLEELYGAAQTNNPNNPNNSTDSLKNLIFRCNGLQLNIHSHLENLKDHLDKKELLAGGNKNRYTSCMTNLSKIIYKEDATSGTERNASHEAARQNPGPSSIGNDQNSPLDSAYQNYTEYLAEYNEIMKFKFDKDDDKNAKYDSRDAKYGAIFFVEKTVHRIMKKNLTQEQKNCLLNTLLYRLEQGTHGVFAPIMEHSSYWLKQTKVSILGYSALTTSSYTMALFLALKQVFPIEMLEYVFLFAGKIAGWCGFAVSGYYSGKANTSGNTNTYDSIHWILSRAINETNPQKPEITTDNVSSTVPENLIGDSQRPPENYLFNQLKPIIDSPDTAIDDFNNSLFSAINNNDYSVISKVLDMEYATAEGNNSNNIRTRILKALPINNKNDIKTTMRDKFIEKLEQYSAGPEQEDHYLRLKQLLIGISEAAIKHSGNEILTISQVQNGLKQAIEKNDKASIYYYLQVIHNNGGINQPIILTEANGTGTYNNFAYHVLTQYNVDKSTGEETSSLIDELLKFANTNAEMMLQIKQIWTKAVLDDHITKKDFQTKCSKLVDDLKNVTPEERIDLAAAEITHLLKTYIANPNRDVNDSNSPPSAAKSLLQFHKTATLIVELPLFILNHINQQTSSVKLTDQKAKAQKITNEVFTKFSQNIEDAVNNTDPTNVWANLRIRKEAQRNAMIRMLRMLSGAMWAAGSAVILIFCPPALALIKALAVAASLIGLDCGRGFISSGITNSRYVTRHKTEEVKRAKEMLSAIYKPDSLQTQSQDELQNNKKLRSSSLIHESLYPNKDGVYNLEANEYDKIKYTRLLNQTNQNNNDDFDKKISNLGLQLSLIIRSIDEESPGKRDSTEFYHRIASIIDSSELSTHEKVLLMWIFKKQSKLRMFSSTKILGRHRNVSSEEKYFAGSIILGGLTSATAIVTSGIGVFTIPALFAIPLMGNASNLSAPVVGGSCDSIGVITLKSIKTKTTDNDTTSYNHCDEYIDKIILQWLKADEGFKTHIKNYNPQKKDDGYYASTNTQNQDFIKDMMLDLQKLIKLDERNLYQFVVDGIAKLRSTNDSLGNNNNNSSNESARVTENSSLLINPTT